MESIEYQALDQKSVEKKSRALSQKTSKKPENILIANQAG